VSLANLGNSEYRMVGQDPAEYDFRDFRSAKLERVRRGAGLSTHAAHDEALLEYRTSREASPPSSASSPRLDALDIRNALAHHPTQAPPFATSDAINVPETTPLAGEEMQLVEQPFWGFAQSGNPDEAFSLDCSWLLDESELPWQQPGDLTRSFSQL
jgi:hypothetical protein